MTNKFAHREKDPGIYHIITHKKNKQLVCAKQTALFNVIFQVFMAVKI